MTLLKRLWQKLFPPYSDECQQILSLLDKEHEWRLGRFTSNEWLIHEDSGFFLKMAPWWPSWRVIRVEVGGVVVTSAFDKHEIDAISYRAGIIHGDLVEKKKTKERADQKTRAQELLKAVLRPAGENI